MTTTQKLIAIALLLLAIGGGYKVAEPRGIRNNNPLNIKDDGVTAWEGLDAPRGDGTFLRFKDAKYCYRAGTRILRSYRKRGIYTLSAIIKAWAPSSENPTSDYIALVSNKSGLGVNHVINDPSDLVPLFRAMATMENGAAFLIHPQLGESTIKAGIAIA